MAPADLIEWLGRSVEEGLITPDEAADWVIESAFPYSPNGEQQ